MKATLGGKLTILVAVVCAAIWLTLLSAPPDAYHVHVYGSNAIFILSMPLGYLSGMFSHTDAGRASELWLYLLLMIPNCFLLGYSVSGLIWLVGRGWWRLIWRRKT